MLLSLPVLAHADIYLIGSSYTWDGIPYALDGAPQWDIYCGEPLIFIYDNPDGACVSSSSPWPETLQTDSFGAILFQPVPAPGSTILSDMFVISNSLANQPTATIVIHQTWPVPDGWEAVFHGSPDQTVTNRSMRYGYELMKWLKYFVPGHEIVLTRSNEMLDQIYHDCLSGCPLPGGFNDLFRDASGHMSAVGQYLTYNALRQVFGQPVGVDPLPPTPELTPEVEDYLDDVVVEYAPEPGGPVSLLVGSSCIGLLARRRRRRARPADAFARSRAQNWK